MERSADRVVDGEAGEGEARGLGVVVVWCVVWGYELTVAVSVTRGDISLSRDKRSPE